MARYIDADVFADRLRNAWKTANEQKRVDIVAIMAYVVTPILVDTPTADVAEVKHGEWLWDNEDIYECSVCNTKTRVDEVLGMPTYRHCPNCGARMDGGRENDRG